MPAHIHPTLAEPLRGTHPTSAARAGLLKWCLLPVLFAFWVGVHSLGDAAGAFVTALGGPWVNVGVAPFVALAMLAATLLQSSSLAASFVVAAAASGVLTPMQVAGLILGVNIGAALSAALAALGHMGRAGEFQRAFCAATAHGVCVLLVALVLLPLQVTWGTFSQSTFWLSQTLVELGQSLNINPIPSSAAWVGSLLTDWGSGIALSTRPGLLRLLCFAVLMLVSFGLFTRVLAWINSARTKVYLQRALDEGPAAGVLVGAVCAVLLQSGRRVTSVLVPLAGADVVSIRQVLPLALGANVGMTLVALLAALAVSGPGSTLATQAALMHLLFNVLCLLLYPWAPLRRVPVAIAEGLARRSVRSKKATFLLLLLLGYVLPLTLALQ